MREDGMRFFYHGSASLAALVAASICAMPASARIAHSATANDSATMQPDADAQASDPVTPVTGATEPWAGGGGGGAGRGRAGRRGGGPRAGAAGAGGARAGRRGGGARART